MTRGCDARASAWPLRARGTGRGRCSRGEDRAGSVRSSPEHGTSAAAMFAPRRWTPPRARDELVRLEPLFEARTFEAAVALVASRGFTVDPTASSRRHVRHLCLGDPRTSRRRAPLRQRPIRSSRPRGAREHLRQRLRPSGATKAGRCSHRGGALARACGGAARRAHSRVSIDDEPSARAKSRVGAEAAPPFARNGGASLPCRR